MPKKEITKIAKQNCCVLSHNNLHRLKSLKTGCMTQQISCKSKNKEKPHYSTKRLELNKKRCTFPVKCYWHPNNNTQRDRNLWLGNKQIQLRRHQMYHCFGRSVHFQKRFAVIIQEICWICHFTFSGTYMHLRKLWCLTCTLF